MTTHAASRFLRWLWRGAVSGLMYFAVGAAAFMLMAIVMRVISDLLILMRLG